MQLHPLFERQRIFAPGPTPVPEEVLSAMSHSPLHHRTEAFVEILGRVRTNLQYLFQTKQPVYLFASSGTGAMEASLVNLLSPGSPVLVINGGKFGERWTKMSERFGLQVQEIKLPWGEAVDPQIVREALKANPKIQAVLVQASETSTGAQHPIQELGQVVRESSDALFIVDAITALGVSPLPMDAWNLDAVITGSQKALMLPPGLAFLAISEKAKARRQKKNPSFYFDLLSEDKAFEKGETAWTPAVSLILGLDVVLSKIQKAGLESVFYHHNRLAEGTRLAVKEMGLELLAKKSPSNAVTACLVPSSVDGKKIITHMRDRFGMTVAEGQDDYKGKMFRLAHLGYYDELDMLSVLSAVEMTLTHLGYKLELGKGVGAATKYFLETEKK